MQNDKNLSAYQIVDQMEDEIDLRELWQTLKKYRLKIALFVLTVTVLSVVYLLSIPNVYKSSTVLAPQTESKSALGGLGALAGMAGIDIGGQKLDTYDYLHTIMQDFSFQKHLIQKYNLAQKLKIDPKNMVFAFGYRGVYDMLHGSKKDKVEKTEEEIVFDTYKKLQKMVELSKDKKSGTITLSVSSKDRYLAKELVDIYLKEATDYLRKLDMQDIEKQIEFYKEEMKKGDNLQLKKHLASLASALVQKRVLSNSSQFYLVRQITKPQVAYIKDKVKPKRALILVVAFVTSLILGVFGAFFAEFLKGDSSKEQ